jgi:transposase
MDLTDEPWAVLSPMIPVPPRRADGRERPWRDPRAVVHGMLWSVRTGAPWQELPPRSPPDHTGQRRFPHGVRCGVVARLLQALAHDLRGRGELDRSACVIDGTFVGAQTGGSGWERPSGARVHRSWPGQPALVFLAPSTLRRLRPYPGPPRILCRERLGFCPARLYHHPLAILLMTWLLVIAGLAIRIDIARIVIVL